MANENSDVEQYQKAFKYLLKEPLSDDKFKKYLTYISKSMKQG